MCIGSFGQGLKNIYESWTTLVRVEADISQWHHLKCILFKPSNVDFDQSFVELLCNVVIPLKEVRALIYFPPLCVENTL